jgi:hypothetical protein
MATLPFSTYFDSLSETTSETAGLATSAGTTVKSDALEMADLVNTSPFLQIDGDFNQWNRGATTASSNGIYFNDINSFRITGGTGDVSRVSSDYASKDYAVYLDSTGGSGVGFREKLKGNIFDGKDLTVILEVKSTSIPSNFYVNFLSNGSTSGSAIEFDLSSVSGALSYIRVDVPARVIGATTDTGFFFYMGNSETANLHIERYRIVESSLIPDDVIPEWIKADEDVFEMAQKVKPYYYNSWAEGSTAASTPNRIVNYAASASLFYSDTIIHPVEMVQTPTVTTYSTATGTAGKLRDESAASDVNSAQFDVGEKAFRVGGTLVANNIYAFHYESDATY